MLTYASPIRDQARTLAWSNWGNIASVWGLFVSIAALFFAKGARTAAREARLRTALEDIENAAKKCTQIGVFAQDEKWLVVRLWAVEVESTCRSTVARWENSPALRDSGSKLLRVANLMSAIIDEVDNAAPNKKNILDAQHSSDNKLSVVLGKMKQDSGSI